MATTLLYPTSYDPAGLACGPLADAALRTWASLAFVRGLIAQGLARDAAALVEALDGWGRAWGGPIGRKVAADLPALRRALSSCGAA